MLDGLFILLAMSVVMAIAYGCPTEDYVILIC